jgi:hypothetical protein
LSPWQLILKYELGCGHVNPYNMACLDVFNCNTNIPIEDISHVYYLTFYGLKSTPKEDSGRV